MKRELNSLDDLNVLLKDRVDLVDSQGYKVAFIKFIQMSLMEILNLLNTGWYFYERPEK